MAHISAENVVVSYPVYARERQRSLLTFAANRASFGRIARDAGKIPIVTAVSGVSVDLRDGDRLALIGCNGSGKTTFLKLCAGFLLPDSGRFSSSGSRATIMHVSAGLNPDLTGVENVELVGRLYGLNKPARRLLLEDVIEFTELGEFITLPVRTYSSGMTMRLAFGLATSINRDILIVDEVIGTGDAHFVSKAAARVRGLFKQAKILVLATHSGAIAQDFCTRAIWLDRGRIVESGDPRAVWAAYTRHEQAGLGAKIEAGAA